MILHLGKFYSPYKGGIETVNQDIAEYTVKKGLYTSVLCFHDLNEKNYLNNVEVIRCKTIFNISSQPISFSYVLNFFRILKKIKIIHIHYPNILALFLCHFSYKKKVVIHWHSDIISNPIINILLLPLEWMMLKRADRIISTSPNYAKNSFLLKRFKMKISIIPIGINNRPKIYEVENHFIKKLIDRGENEKIILSIGRFVKYKGFKYLLKAMLLIKTPSILLLVGNGPLKKEFEDFIYKNKLDTKIFLLSGLSNTEINLLYTKADIFVLPSISKAEACGVVLAEAMSYSLPVVATNIKGSGVSWVNKDGASGLNAKVRDEVNLAQKIELILNDHELYHQLADGAYKRFSNYFTIEKNSEIYISLYKSLL